MRAYERCERGQKAVGVRLAVDAADDLLVIQPVRREKLLFQRNVPLEDAVHQVAPQHGPAALVAQHIAQRWDVFQDFAVAAQAGVRSRAEDAGDALSAAPERPRRAQQVRFDRNVRRSEVRFQLPAQLLARLREGLAAPRAVESHARHAVAWRQFREGFAYLFGRVLHGVDPPRAHVCRPCAVAGDPRAFGRSAVGYKYHNSKIRINLQIPEKSHN